MTGWIWIDEHLALAVHEQLLVRHGGLSGRREGGLLQSALARPKQLDSYGEEVNAIALAAAYTAAILQNHPFADGNMRTGFVVGVLFLELNGLAFGAREEEAASAVLTLAAGQIDEAAYRNFLRANVTSPPS